MDVRIYVRSKSAMQSGRARVGRVVMKPVDMGARATDPLMGWTSAPDTLGEIEIGAFQNIEEAVAYAKKRGWIYHVDPVQTRRVLPRNYTDAFKYIPPAVKDLSGSSV